MRDFNTAYRNIAKRIEIIGNKIPHPFWLFVILTFIIIALSFLLSGKETYYVENNSIISIKINNLASLNYILTLIGDLNEIFIYFKPLSVVILILMGISIFQGSGAISAVIRGASAKIPINMFIIFAAFIGVNGNIASDVSVIIVPTLFAALFQSLNFNPWVGIVVGYASVNGGWTLNMFIAGTDAILSEITNTVLRGFRIQQTINPFSNWYFMFVGSILVIILTVFVTEKYTKKVLPNPESTMNMSYISSNRLSKAEKMGLKYLFYANIVFFLILLWITKHYNINHGIAGLDYRFLMDNIIGIIFLYFVTTGLVFGFTSGSIKKLNMIPDILANGIIGAKTFIVTALPASVFVKVLADSNLDSWIGVVISGLLIKTNMPSLLLLIFFMIIISLLNLVITSSSVKWLFVAPIAIPIFNQISISPEIVQLAYRIGDTVTNCISPVDYYLPIIISLFEMYKLDSKTKVGIGTMISLTFPYTIAYFLGLSALFIIWYLLALPVGF